MALPLRKLLANSWQKSGPTLRYVSGDVADTVWGFPPSVNGTNLIDETVAKIATTYNTLCGDDGEDDE